MGMMICTCLNLSSGHDVSNINHAATVDNTATRMDNAIATVCHTPVAGNGKNGNDVNAAIAAVAVEAEEEAAVCRGIVIQPTTAVA
jgi:hypothetical protein